MNEGAQQSEASEIELTEDEITSYLASRFSDIEEVYSKKHLEIGRKPRPPSINNPASLAQVIVKGKWPMIPPSVLISTQCGISCKCGMDGFLARYAAQIGVVWSAVAIR